MRVSVEPFNSKSHCLFRGNEMIKSLGSANFEEFSCVKTDSFVETILSHCKDHNDNWAFTVHGRIEYYEKDLHAADYVYHRSCDTNFRKKRDIPLQY